MIVAERRIVVMFTVKEIKMIKQVTDFRYLGEDYNVRKPVEELSRIEKSRIVFMRIFVTSNKQSLDLSLRMIRCYIFSDLLYCCESSTFNSVMKNLQVKNINILYSQKLSTFIWMEIKTLNLNIFKHENYLFIYLNFSM